LDDVSVAVQAGTTLGIVGESGSGKSTLAKTIVGIHRPSGGRILLDGADITAPDRRTRQSLRRRIQLIPQDPYSSLDPRRRIGETLAEAIDPRRAQPRRHNAEISRLLELVALPTATAERYPHEFSGGQRQRIAIARALAVRPELIIADEVTSALDVSTQAEVLSLLEDLKNNLGLTLVFISHNLAVVQRLSDTVLVLLHGRAVERGNAADIFQRPQHDYTRTLLESVPGVELHPARERR
jgi:peptide/nickel transport system ATP-binding protein